MGSLFSTPKIPAPPPPPAEPDSGAEEAAARLREIARRRRGRDGTIATGPTGVRFTAPAQDFVRRSLLGLKNRLGE